MSNSRRLVFLALIAAGLFWGTTVPLSRLALGWLPPAWLAFTRFALAAAILVAARGPRVRAMCRPAVLASGGVGYGASVVLQNLGIMHTSVTHAALIIGATPVLIAIIAALWRLSVAKPVAWAGFAVSLAGVGLVAGGKGGGATLGGDGLVLASQLLSAAFTVVQARLLRGRDPVDLTAAQFLGAALAVLPVALATEGIPAGPAGPVALLATAGLAFCGTVLPFTLFAYGQTRVSAEVAGAFVNIEPLVGAMAGAVVFGDPVGRAQVAGGAAILAGIGLSSVPLLRTRRGEDPAAGEHTRRGQHTGTGEHTRRGQHTRRGDHIRPGRAAVISRWGGDQGRRAGRRPAWANGAGAGPGHRPRPGWRAGPGVSPTPLGARRAVSHQEDHDAEDHDVAA